MLYYEKVEQQFGDYLLQKKPKNKRDSILEKVPNDQLICLLNFMEVEEVRFLFSPQMIKKCFENTPIEDTFPLLRDCKDFYLEFLTKKDIQIRIEFMSFRLFTQEMYYHYKVLEKLLQDNVISRQLVLTKLHSATLSQLANLCREDHIWKKWIFPHPLLEQLPFPTDISTYIFSFL